jgi:hypothetical protein
MWLTDEDFRDIGAELQDAYGELPGQFMDFAARISTRRGGGRVGVLAIRRFYIRHLGRDEAPNTPIEWMSLPEQRLATVTNGEVFRDSLGKFSDIREKLLGFYPEDVRIKKIAARAAVMGQSGQYNYARCMSRGEVVAARMALGEFIGGAVSIVFLLNKRYTPFYKWMHRAMRGLPLLHPVAAMIRELALGYPEEKYWTGDRVRLLRTLNTDDKNVVLIEKICENVIMEMRRQGLSSCDDDFLASHADELMSHIRDERIRGLHVMEG